MILLTYVNSPTGSGRRFRYVRLEEARRKAHELVTPRPNRDPDGYAVHPKNGNCLLFREVTFEELFPDIMR